MGYPAGLHIVERAGPDPGAAAVVFVHGSLDRGESFRRAMRRLPDLTVVAYDRRGYQASRGAGVVGLGGHIADLVAILGEVRSHGASPVVAVGHSVGGDVVLGAALAAPGTTDAIGAFEPPMPWLGFRRRPPDRDAAPGAAPPGEDPGDEVERFFSRMVSPSAWERLSDGGRAARRADGPALVADLQSVRGDPPSTSWTSPFPLSSAWVAQPVRRTTGPRSPGWGPMCRAPRSTRSRQPTMVPTSRTRTVLSGSRAACSNGRRAESRPPGAAMWVRTAAHRRAPWRAMHAGRSAGRAGTGALRTRRPFPRS